MSNKINIYCDDVWAGSGRLDSDGEIRGCAAILGPDQDASEETYEAIQDAIDSDPQDAGRYTGSGSVERPDGVYSWTIEAYRKTRMDDHLPHRLGIEVEMADAVIRIADLSGHLGLDLGGAILEKMAYNAKREDHKIENRKKSGGKAF